MSFTSANLLWQKRFRGLMAVGPHSVTDDGSAVLIRPDEFESRTYQVFLLDANGNSRDLRAVSVETIHRFDAAPDGRLVLGMTYDDLYLFREGKKARFAADRRVNYTDLCLSPSTGWFVFGYADALVSRHGIGFGDANGRLAWNRELPAAVNRVALAGDGRALTVGLQDGRVLALDNMRSPLWECLQEEAVTALAMPASGNTAAAGTADGTLFYVDHDGGFRWRTPAGYPVVAVATDAEGQWVGAALSDGHTHLLVCVGPDGSPVWEHDLEFAPTGISLSPNGRFLLVSLANARAVLFEVDLRQAAGSLTDSRRDRDRAAAQAAREQGQPEKALALLTALLSVNPADLEVAREALEVEHQLQAAAQATAREHAGAGQFREALTALDAAAARAPWDADLFQERLQYWNGAVRALEARAGELETTLEWEAARQAWTEVLELDPRRVPAREALLRIREAQAAELMTEGDMRRDLGDLEGAVALWQQAQQLDPSPALEARLRAAEVERCVARGIAHYEAQRLPEAVFQLRKALSLDPHNDQAQRYLGYAQGQSGDTLIADRFARLE